MSEGRSYTGLTGEEVVERLRAAVKAAGTTAAFARAHGLHGTEVGDVLHGRRSIPPRLAHALGFRRMALYVPLTSP